MKLRTRIADVSAPSVEGTMGHALREALLDDGAELLVGPGEREKLVVVCDLLRTAVRAIGIDTKSLGQACIALRDSTFVGALQLLAAFAARRVSGRPSAGHLLANPAA